MMTAIMMTGVGVGIGERPKKMTIEDKSTQKENVPLKFKVGDLELILFTSIYRMEGEEESIRLYCRGYEDANFGSFFDLSRAYKFYVEERESGVYIHIISPFNKRRSIESPGKFIVSERIRKLERKCLEKNSHKVQDWIGRRSHNFKNCFSIDDELIGSGYIMIDNGELMVDLTPTPVGDFNRINQIIGVYTYYDAISLPKYAIERFAQLLIPEFQRLGIDVDRFDIKRSTGFDDRLIHPFWDDRKVE